MSENDLPTGKLKRAGIAGLTTARIGLKHLTHKGKNTFRPSSQHKTEVHEAEIGKILINTLMQLRGTALKVAQMMSMQLDMLPDGVRTELAKACSQVTPLNRAHIRKVFISEFKRSPEQIFESFDANAFAAASLGQVHRATSENGEQLAVKIQYPGIAASIKSDVQLVGGIMKSISKSSSYLPPWETIEGVLSDIQQQLEREVDYVQEAENTHWFATNLNVEGVRIPKVHQNIRSEKILVTEFLVGTQLDEWLANNPTQQQCNHFGQLIFDSFCYQLHDLGVLHADPHPGNFLICDDGSMALLDFGCVQHLDKDFSKTFTYLCSNDPKDLYLAYQTRGLLREDVSYTQFESEFFPVVKDLQHWMTAPFLQAKYDFSAMPPMPQGDLSQLKKLAKQVGKTHQDQIYFDRSYIGILSLLRKMKAHINTSGFLRDE